MVARRWAAREDSSTLTYISLKDPTDFEPR